MPHNLEAPTIFQELHNPQQQEDEQNLDLQEQESEGDYLYMNIYTHTSGRLPKKTLHYSINEQ